MRWTGRMDAHVSTFYLVHEFLCAAWNYGMVLTRSRIWGGTGLFTYSLDHRTENLVHIPRVIRMENHILVYIVLMCVTIPVALTRGCSINDSINTSAIFWFRHTYVLIPLDLVYNWSQIPFLISVYDSSVNYFSFTPPFWIICLIYFQRFDTPLPKKAEFPAKTTK